MVTSIEVNNIKIGQRQSFVVYRHTVRAYDEMRSTGECAWLMLAIVSR